MEENLGTIAKSGSLGFKQAMEKNEDIDIIGQFGVGFYAAFMVASSVTVISRKYGQDTAWKWVSDGTDGYTIEPADRAYPGTDVIMTLKSDTEDDIFSRFLEEYEIRSLVKKYSDYIRYPIRMEISKSRIKEDSSADRPEYESYMEEETLNSMIPIWQRGKKDVTDEIADKVMDKLTPEINKKFDEFNASFDKRFKDIDDKLASDKEDIKSHTTQLNDHESRVGKLEGGNKALCQGMLALLKQNAATSNAEKAMETYLITGEYNKEDWK
jgi:HSP90 family molecular chaperone